MKKILREIYDEYIGWIILIIVIFPPVVLLDIKFLEMIKKLTKNK